MFLFRLYFIFELFVKTDEIGLADRKVRLDRRIYIAQENKKSAFIQFDFWFVQRTLKL